MRNMRSDNVITAVLVIGLLGTGPAVANDPQATAAEWAMLPQWCQFATAARKTSPSQFAQIKEPAIRSKIKALDASGCNGYHHYCWAQIWANRAYFYEGGDSSTLTSYYKWALSDLRYVFRNSEPGDTCSLFPEMHAKMGEMQFLLGKTKEAEASYHQAIALKPGYTPAYVGLSDMYETKAENDKAIAILQAGLKTNPGSSALKKKLARLQARLTAQGATP